MGGGKCPRAFELESQLSTRWTGDYACNLQYKKKDCRAKSSSSIQTDQNSS